MCLDNPTVRRLVSLASADLKRRLGPKSPVPEVKAVAPVDWPDAGLGCPEAGKLYAAVVTPGYRIELESGGVRYRYHTDRARVKLCTGGTSRA